MKETTDHYIEFDRTYYNPYFLEMAISLWNRKLPVKYINSEKDIVQRYPDGKVEIIKKNDCNDNLFDKRYTSPFEDDGAYAD